MDRFGLPVSCTEPRAISRPPTVPSMKARSPGPDEGRKSFQGGVQTGTEAFEEGDFHALSPACARDAQYDDRRLVLRRKLLALGKLAVARAGELGLALEARGSLHSPSTFNPMKVERMWAYLCRTKAEKKRLRGEL